MRNHGMFSLRWTNSIKKSSLSYSPFYRYTSLPTNDVFWVWKARKCEKGSLCDQLWRSSDSAGVCLGPCCWAMMRRTPKEWYAVPRTRGECGMPTYNVRTRELRSVHTDLIYKRISGLRSSPTLSRRSAMPWRSETYPNVWRNLSSCVERSSKAKPSWTKRACRSFTSAC